MKNNRSEYNPSRKHEDKLLKKYWKEHGGLVYVEVRVGQGGVKTYPPGAMPRRIDAVRVPVGRKILVSFMRRVIPEFVEAVRGRKIEVIEIKRKLNRPAIGQVIVGAKLMEIEYPQIRKIQQVILCETSDPVLEMICRELKIKVWKPEW
jgi:hypothetical protein